ncbi:hypothetical protein NVIE_2211 [Nitrososphaera viennensis EN76]|uniref:Uncharacterized protein n=1 Tax=Nitrososphaera viennensis EN76 TaxID=926571 RepID=A0A060HMR9_9ARCH|nr:hypothetical protein NVIE_2211 [Nitrososphaera viennensis EN76]
MVRVNIGACYEKRALSLAERFGNERTDFVCPVIAILSTKWDVRGAV